MTKEDFINNIINNEHPDVDWTFDDIVYIAATQVEHFFIQDYAKEYLKYRGKLIKELVSFGADEDKLRSI